MTTVSADRSLVRVTYVAASFVTGVLAVVLAMMTAAKLQTWLGIPDPGIVTTYGLPVLKTLADGAGAVTIGGLLLAAFLVPPQANGVLDVDGYRGMRTASNAAVVWAVCSYALVPLTLSDVSGQSLMTTIKAPGFIDLVSEVEAADAWLWSGIIALVVAGLSRIVIRWGWAPILLVAGFGGLIPRAISGHASAGGSHDYAVNSLMIHLFAASVWIGGLVAVLVLAVYRSTHLPLAVRRFSVLAGLSIAAMAASGVINALIRITPEQLLTTDYGRMVFLKIVILCALGFVGLQHRTRTLPTIESDSTPFIRLALVEVGLFALVLAVAVSLGRTPPPGATVSPSKAEVVLGYDLAGPPSVARILFDWRFNLIYGTLAIILAVLYALGVRRLRQRGDLWPVGRTVAWMLGSALLLFATSSGVGRYATAMFSVHMSEHMLLSMMVPILLVLGAPVTLALRALPPAGRGGAPGPREWILAAVHNPVSRFLTHPAIAGLIFVAGFYGLYLGGIFEKTVGSHFGHLLMTGHFLISGYLFYWVAIGIDPRPRPTAPVARLGMVLAVLPFHAFFALAMMSMSTVMGASYYRGLGLPWDTDLLADQKLGGSLAWATGELPLLVVMIALLMQWSRSDQREARRRDRAADRDNDAELEAYNAMLREMDGRRPR